MTINPRASGLQLIMEARYYRLLNEYNQESRVHDELMEKKYALERSLVRESNASHQFQYQHEIREIDQKIIQRETRLNKIEKVLQNLHAELSPPTIICFNSRVVGREQETVVTIILVLA